MAAMGSRQSWWHWVVGALVLLGIAWHGSRLGYRETIAHAGAGDDDHEPPPLLVRDAHRLAGADDFRPHFRAVRHVLGLTLAGAAASCVWQNQTNVDYQYSNDTEWVTSPRQDSEMRQRRREWQDWLARPNVSWSEVADRFDGRGIVIVAGHDQSLFRTHVALRALRRVGSALPVEIQYFGAEMSEQNRTDLRAQHPAVSFLDLAAGDNVVAASHDRLTGYNLKTAAVLNSRFAEILLLDSDNIPLLDPAVLFDSATYQEYGTVFWPDIARTRPQNPMWAITNTACRLDEYEQESGQMLVDKRRFFYHLQLAAWFNRRRYYDDFLLGDKDMFRFAWHALQTAYGRPRKWVTSLGSVHFAAAAAAAAAAVPGEGEKEEGERRRLADARGLYCGHSFAQHHPDTGVVAFMHGGLLKTVSGAVLRHNRAEEGGTFTAYQRAPHDEDPARVEPVTINWDPTDWLDTRKYGQPDAHASCAWMPNVPPRSIEEIVPGAERIFEEVGGYWMLDESR